MEIVFYMHTVKVSKIEVDETIICTHVMDITNAAIITWKPTNLHLLFTHKRRHRSLTPFTMSEEATDACVVNNLWFYAFVLLFNL